MARQIAISTCSARTRPKASRTPPRRLPRPTASRARPTKRCSFLATPSADDLGLGQSKHGVDNQWVELGRPGDTAFTAYYSVARQLYADKYGEKAVLKLDQMHRTERTLPPSVTHSGFKSFTWREKADVVDLKWQYKQLDKVFKEAVKDYEPEYDAQGNLKKADPYTRVAQFSQSWDFSYSEKGASLDRSTSGVTDIQGQK